MKKAGLTLATSCNSFRNDNDHSGSGAGDNTTADKIPEYRNNLKSDFADGKTKSANDKLVIALIGAGSWGTNLIELPKGV